MTDKRRLLCNDLAFACIVGAVAHAAGLFILLKWHVPIYRMYDFGLIGGLFLIAVVLWLCSLEYEDETAPEKTFPQQTNTPE